MKTIFNNMLLAAVLTLAWGCSSGDDEVTGPAFEASSDPAWAVDMHSDQPMPQWQPPTPSRYENKMIMMLRLQDELVPYSTDDDRMAVFVGDECRALSRRAGNGSIVYFVLNIYGTATDSGEYSLCYYSGGLHQEFRYRDTYEFLNEMNIGTESDLILDLMSGTTKYAQQTAVTVTPKPTDKIAIDPEADRVGVFVNGECRGVGRPETAFNVYHQQKGEQAQVRYYSKGRGGIYTLPTTLTLSTEAETVEFNLQ